MKSMSRAVMREKSRLENERKQKERDEYISSLSEEERKEFFSSRRGKQKARKKSSCTIGLIEGYDWERILQLKWNT